MDEAKIRKIFQEEIQKYMVQKQYSISRIPSHEHNGTDTIKIPLSSIKESAQIPATGGSVFDPTILAGQYINNEPTSGLPTYKTITVVPQTIIQGFGVGVASAFNGGNAPDGTMVVFANSTSFAQLYIMVNGTWRGVALDLIA